MNGLFVTGTDTDAGKTLVALGLMVALQRQGRCVLGMKPVAAGCVATPAGWRNADALALAAQGSAPQPYAWVNPFAFAPPIAPHLAAAAVGAHIELAPIQAAFAALRARAELVVVEGAGGWRVPLGPGLAISDLPVALGLPVVLTVGIKLGCLNHARLSAEHILASGASWAGWIATQRDPDMVYREENLAALHDLLPPPCLGTVPWLTAPMPARVADCLDAAALACLCSARAGQA